MARKSKESYLKKSKADKKRKAREAKFERRLEKKNNDSSSKLDDMLAYVDENGVIVSDKPEPEDAESSTDKTNLNINNNTDENRNG